MAKVDTASKKCKRHDESKEKTSVRVEEMEENFPRGGKEDVTPLERRVLRQKAKEDVLFNETGDVKGSDSAVAGVKRATAGTNATGVKKRKTKILEFPRPKTLHPGSLLLGAVQDVHQLEVLVSLPYNMRGSIAITDISDVLTELVQAEANLGDDGAEVAEQQSVPKMEQLFQIGSLLPCYVTAVRDTKVVSLSINPRLVNANLSASDVKADMVIPGWIKSAEDHGYIVDFGVASKDGFLLKKNAEEFVETCNKGKPLSRGQVVQCLILGGADARSVPVTINPSRVRPAILPATTTVILQSLLPGVLVNITLQEVALNGVIGSFLGSFEGWVGVHHLHDGSHSLDKVQLKKKMKGRIVWVDVQAKMVGLAMCKHIVQNECFQFGNLEIGDKFEAATVVWVDSPRALILDLGNSVFGFCPLGLIYDERKDAIGKEYKIGSRHPCRLVQFNRLDGFGIVSLQPSVLERPYMKFADLKVGEVVEGKVERHGDYGMTVSLTDTIRGMVPRLHLADVDLKNPKARFKEGGVVKCRVLSLEPEKRRLLLTCKRSLVQSAKEHLCDYSRAKPGEVYLGVIAAVRDIGCVVRFFGDVVGRVHKLELSSTQLVSDPKAMFSVGQTVECRVVECNPASKELKLSFRLDGDKPLASTGGLDVSMVMDLEVMGIASGGINLRAPSGELAFLPTPHLSDYLPLCPSLLKLHQAGLEKATREGTQYTLKVTVVCKKLNFRPALVTLKSSIVEQIRKEGKGPAFSDLKVGMVRVGFIKKTMPYGCFVEFPNNCCGLAPIKSLSDEFVVNPADLYQEMQTVRAKIAEVDTAKERFLLTLKPSDLKMGNRLSQKEVFEDSLVQFERLLGERDLLLRDQGALEGTLMKAFRPGSCTEAEVTGVQGNLVMLELGDRVKAKGVLHAQTDLEVGSNVTVCILDVDVSDSSLVVSLNPRLVEAGSAKKSVKGNKKKLQHSVMELGSTVMATVEYKTPYYVLCSCSTIAGVYPAFGIFDAGQLGCIPDSVAKLKPGEQISAVILRQASVLRSTLDGPPIVHLLSTPPTRQHLSSTQQHMGPVEVNVGDIIDVVVQKIAPTQINVKHRLLRGRIHCTMLKDSVEKGFFFSKGIGPGDVIRARVIACNEQHSEGVSDKLASKTTVLDLTTKPSLMDPSVPITKEIMEVDLTPGKVVTGYITEVGKGLNIALSSSILVHAPPLLVTNKIEVLQKLSSHYTPGEAVECTVVKHGSSGRCKGLVSLMGGPAVEPKVGDVIMGHPLSLLSKEGGLLVSLPFSSVGRVDITNVTDHYVDNPLQAVKKLDFIKCYILSVEGDKIELSLRASRTGEEVIKAEAASKAPVDPELRSVEDLEVGQLIRGYVKASSNVGIFVRLGPSIDGRVKITNLCDGFVKDFKSIHPVGKLVKAKVLGVELGEKKVELSLRLSHVDPAAAKELRKTQGKGKGKGKKVRPSSDGENAEESSSSEEEEAEVSSEEEEDGEEEGVTGGGKVTKATLKPTGGFVWDTSQLKNDLSSSEEEEEEDKLEEPPAKKSKRQKRATKMAEEASLYSTEQILMDTNRPPETPDDFDRLLVSRPNSSAIWVQYMAFHLHTAEVDKARAIAQRALKTISFREEREKLNVWVALMNLENIYGTPESLVEVFEEALKQNDTQTVFFKLTSIYTRAKKFDLAEQLYQTMIKRFGASVKVWTHYGLFLMKQGRLQAARSLLQKCLKNIPSKQHHVDAISKFAQLEFEYGEPERGATEFESLVSTYPKRVDLWSVYIDMMLKKGEIKRVREIFERAIHLKISAKKMRFIFKRYVEFEKAHGTGAHVESIREKARTYVESKALDNATD
eukprot:Em0013g187a